MKKYWALLAFAIAIICFLLTGELFSFGYKWNTDDIPMTLMLIAIFLGIPSGIILFFYVCKFLIVSIIHPTYKVTFLITLWMGIIIIVLMCLYPPWVEIYRLPSSNIKGVNPVGYTFLWLPPEINNRFLGISIDYTRLMLQILVVGLITGGLLFTLWLCKSKEKTSCKQPRLK